MKLRELFSTIKLDTAAALRGLSKFDAEMDKVSDSMSDAEKRATKVENAFKSVGKFAGEAGKQIATGLGVGVAAIQGAALAANAMVSEWAQGIGEIETRSKALDIPIRQLQQLKAVAESNGLEFDNATDFVKDFGVKIAEAIEDPAGDAAQALALLGLSAVDLANDQPIDQMRRYADAISNVENRTKRVEIADRLASDAAVLMGAAFTEGSEGIDKAIESAEKAGTIIGEDGVEAALEYNKAMKAVRGTMQGVKNTVFSELAPAFTDIARRVGEWAEENRELISSQLLEWLERIVDLAEKMGPVLIDVAEGVGDVVDAVGGIDDALILAGEGFVAFKLLALASLNPILATVGLISLGLLEVMRRTAAARADRDQAEKDVSKLDPDDLLAALSEEDLAKAGPAGQRLLEKIAAAKAAKDRATSARTGSELDTAERDEVAPDEFGGEDFNAIAQERVDSAQLQQDALNAYGEAADALKDVNKELSKQARVDAKARDDERKAKQKERSDKERRLSDILVAASTRSRDISPAEAQEAQNLANALGIPLSDAQRELLGLPTGKKGGGKGKKKKDEPTIEELIFGKDGKLSLGSAQPRGLGTTIIQVDASIRVAPPQITINVSDLPAGASAGDVAREIETRAGRGLNEQTREAYDAQVRQIRG